MSQQLQITGGAKVRSLEGVITGSTGVLGSLPINGSNGIPQLDVNGKILVSQLPNSVMEYLGTWDAATNTPTLANGTGNAGDVYLCNVAGTVNFGAGPITFYVGDQVIYSGSIWQRASGATGSVTSVAVTETGDALTITGSPITTSGTINIGFAGTSAQYVAGNGALVTFPALTGYVPYTGATATLDMGSFDVNARGFKVNGTAGSGHVDFKHQSGTPTGSASSTTLYADTNGDMAWKNDHNYITTFDSHSNTADRIYTLPNASGTVALTSDLSAYVPTSRTLTINGVTYDLSANRSWTISTGISGSGTTNYISKWTGSTALGNSLIYDNGTNVGIGTASPTAKLSVAGTTAISGQLTLGDTITNGTYTYTLPGATGVLALTSDLTIYVTLGTLQTITGTKIYSSLQYFDNNVYIKHSISGSSAGYTTLGASASGLNINLASGTSNNSLLFASTSASNTYTFPNATGTIALTTDLANYLPLTGGTLTGALTGTNASFNYISFNNSATAPPTITGFSSLSFISNGSFLSMNVKRADGQRTTINIPNDGLTHQYDFPTTDGTIALTSNLSSYVPTSRTLTINGTTYDLSANRSWTISAGVSGSGTTNYIPKFTGSTSIGNSLIYDSGSSIGINGIPTTYSTNVYFDVIGNTTTQGGIIQSRNSDNSVIGSFITNVNGLNIRTETTHPMLFSTAAVERMRITAAGLVGIGTSSPLPPASRGGLVVRGNSNGGEIMLQNTDSTDGSAYGLTLVMVNNGGGTNSGDGGLLNRNNGFLNFATNNTERMRITSGGNVCIGKTSYDNTTTGITLAGLTDGSVGSFVADGGACLLMNRKSSTGTLMVIRYNSTDVGSISTNGSTTSYNITSDYRLKEDLKDINGLDKISKIKVYDFKWKNSELRMDGVLAHELQEIIPFAVTGEKDAMNKDGRINAQGVDYSKIVPVLIKAIQEQQTQINELKAKLN